MSLEVAVLAAILAFGVSAVVAGRFRQWAIRHALLDVPNGRSSHVTPVPRGGGVGIVAGFVIGIMVWAAFGGAISPRALGWLAGGLLVATVSFLDDVRSLPILPRLAAHLTGAGVLTFAGVQGREAPLPLELALAFAWVTLVTNVYNFMDGIDGMAACQAIVVGGAYAIAGGIVGNPLVSVAGLLLGAGAAGFLPFNLPPARLFMGDVASTFLGFQFAALPLLANLGVGGNRLPMDFGVVVLAPFLFDGVVTLVRRIMRGERWYQAHRSHYYQRLVQAGLSHGQVTGLYAVLGGLAAVAALAGLVLGGLARTSLGVAAYLLMLGVVVAVWRLGPRPPLRATG